MNFHLGAFTKNTITDAVYTILLVVDEAIIDIQPYGRYLFYTLAVLEVCIFGVMIAFGKHQDIGEIIVKFLTISVLFWVNQNLDVLTFQVAESISMLSEKVIDVSNSTFTEGIEIPDIYNPTAVYEVGWNFINDIEDAFLEKRELFGLGDKLPKVFDPLAWQMMIIKGCFFVVFSVLCIQLAIAQIELHIILFFGTILFPFSVFGPLKWMGEKVLPAIFGQCLRLGLVIFSTCISLAVIINTLHVPDSGNLEFHTLIQMVVIALICGFLAVQVPAMASSLLSGMPNLTASSFMQNMTGFASMGRMAGVLFKGAGSSTIKTAKGENMVGQGIRSGATKIKNAMQRDPNTSSDTSSEPGKKIAPKGMESAGSKPKPSGTSMNNLNGKKNTNGSQASSFQRGDE